MVVSLDLAEFTIPRTGFGAFDCRCDVTCCGVSTRNLAPEEVGPLNVTWME